ncbi:MAG: protein kinase, partial [Magnetococcales bacterium]|nr:protein kinase [Magnetococcales bacterium]
MMDIGTAVVDGRYRVGAVIVPHPTGRLIAAHDVERNVAVLLKEIPVLLSSRFEHYFTEFKRRFHLLQSLRHPAIVLPLAHVYDRPLDRHFLVFDAETGEPLRDYLRRQPGGCLAVTEAMEFGQRIALALDYAHRQGVVCGGLRLDNVLLYPDRQIRLSGCLDHELHALLLRVDATVADEISPSVAPEQCLLVRHQGEAGWCLQPHCRHGQVRLLPTQPTVSGDIYALAALLHELLFGQPPSFSATADNLSLSNLTGITVSLSPDVTARLGQRGERLLQQALAVDPQQRPKRVGTWMQLLEGEVQVTLLSTLTEPATPEAGPTTPAPSSQPPQPPPPPAIAAPQPLLMSEFTVSPSEMVSPPPPRLPPPPPRLPWIRSHRLLAASLAAVVVTGVLSWKLFWPGIADEKSAAEMRDLVRSAERDLDAFQMTMNSGSYAYEKYREALRRNPDNGDARRGITVVAEKYAQLAQVAIGNLADLAIRAPMASGNDSLIADELRNKQKELDEQRQRMSQLETRLRELEPSVARLSELEEKVRAEQRDREQLTELTQRLQRAQETRTAPPPPEQRRPPLATPAPGLRVEEAAARPTQELKVAGLRPEIHPPAPPALPSSLPSDHAVSAAPPPTTSGYAIQVGAFGDA